MRKNSRANNTVNCCLQQPRELYTCQIRFSDTPVLAKYPTTRFSRLSRSEYDGTSHSVENSLISLSCNHNVQNVKDNSDGRGKTTHSPVSLVAAYRSRTRNKFDDFGSLFHFGGLNIIICISVVDPLIQGVKSDVTRNCSKHTASITYLACDKPAVSRPAFDFSRSSTHRCCNQTIHYSLSHLPKVFSRR